MTDATKKVLDMVAEGKVSADEGEHLLKAMASSNAGSFWKLLYKPFASLGTGSGILLAVAAVLACFGVAFLGIRFDGALDLHLAATNTTLAALDAANSWLTTSVLLWLCSLVVAKQGRFVDFLIAVGIARWPMALTGLILGVAMTDPASLAEQVEANPNNPALILVALAVLPGIVWMVTLLYQGFKHASGLRGGRLVATFIVGISVAEIATKVLLALAP